MVKEEIIIKESMVSLTMVKILVKVLSTKARLQEPNSTTKVRRLLELSIKVQEQQ